MVLREAVLLTVMSLLSGCAAVGRIAEQEVRLRSAAARMLSVCCVAFGVHRCSEFVVVDVCRSLRHIAALSSSLMLLA